VNKKPLILTHRGDCENGIENTIHAVDLALAQGATGVEIDVRQTGTGEVVVFHDFSMRRMFNKSGYIGKTSFEKLKKISYSQSKGSTDYYIDTLDSFLEHFTTNTPIILDAKTIHFFDFRFADKLINIISNHNMIDNIWISCFNPFLLQILKIKNKNIRTGYLFQRTSLIHNTYDLITSTDAWHPHHRILSTGLVKRAKKRNKKLYIWIVNDEVVFNKVMNYDIDGIITDNVPLVSRLLSD